MCVYIYIKKLLKKKDFLGSKHYKKMFILRVKITLENLQNKYHKIEDLTAFSTPETSSLSLSKFANHKNKKPWISIWKWSYMVLKIEPN